MSALCECGQPASGTCERCGSFRCEACPPPPEDASDPRLCGACLDSLGLGRHPWMLRCGCGRAPRMTVNDATLGLSLYPLMSLSKLFGGRPFMPVSSERSWGERFRQAGHALNPWGERWAPQRRCLRCHIAWVALGERLRAQDIAARGTDALCARELPASCPECEHELEREAFQVYSLFHFRPEAKVNRWTLRHHGLNVEGRGVIERTREGVGFLARLESAWMPVAWCGPCEVLVLRYATRIGDRELRKAMKALRERREAKG